MIAMTDDCEPKKGKRYAYELTTDYAEGRRAAIDGFEEKDNPYIRAKKPFEWLCWYAGHLAGKYGTE